MTANQQQPLTPEQITSYERPTEAVISPDGSRVAYVVEPVSKDVSKEVEHGKATIWVVSALDGEPRQFTGGEWLDKEPRWSPDGARLAFLSDRAERGESSVYVMRSDGGEAVRVFDQQGSMSDLSWSPDGSRLAVLFTDPETDEEKRKKEEKDDARVWDETPKWRRLWVIDPEAKSAQAVSPEERQVWGYTWSPEGERLAINTSPKPRFNDIFGDTEIATVPRDGGEATHVLTIRGAVGDMAWSSDGERLAFQSSEGKAVIGEHVFSVSIAGGEPVNLTPDLDGTVYSVTPVKNGASLLLHIVYGCNSSARWLSWEGELTPIVDRSPWGFFASQQTIDNDGERIAVVWEDSSNPPNVYVLETSSGEIHQRTSLNQDLKDAALGEAEIVRWESDPGVEVEGVLVKPHGYQEGERYPLVVQVHGGPNSHWGNEFFAGWHHWAHYLAGRGYAVLMPNPRGSTGRGSEYLNALFGDVGGGEFRDMMAGVDAMIERGIADPDRLGIGGWSWGGYMTAWSVTQTDRFKAAVMGAGLPNMISDNSIGDIPAANLSYFEASAYEDPDAYYERSAIRYITNCVTPVLILHGEADDRVNMHQGMEMYTALRELGKEHQFVTYPREPHGIRERKHQLDLITRVGDWYDRYLKS